MSVNCQQSSSCPIPSRFGNSKDWPLLPDSYSQTPDGTLFSTTPGGTKIIYERKFLLECRNSPIARTPPCCLPHIPGVTAPPLGKLPEGMENSPHLAGGTFVLSSSTLIERQHFQGLAIQGYPADDDQFMIDI